ncbi:MAG: PD-(D/E)XK nuclease family protein [Gemmatimonadota bacterium]|nr:PD-(D/E)XK nuclease family protein [Gemmatimonadota bacterium]MDE2872998.1 PD-(D/E)XK nuclease family protein [Gemmatimonadota bacterium]
MSQLYLDFDGAPPGPAPPPSADIATACVLVRELERVVRRGGRARKVLVARTRGEGKELLRQLALRGRSWVGFEVSTLRPLATGIVARAGSFAGLTIIDAFDEHALVERAIDEVLRGGRGFRFRGLAEKVGFRDAVRHSVAALRLGGVRARSPGDAAADAPSGRRALITAVLRRYEELLAEGALADNAHLLGTATEILEDDTARPPLRAPTFLVPGLPDRGLAGRFARALQRRGATLLRTDPVEGLPPPKGILWDVAPPAAPGSYLHAVERHEGPRPRIELFAAGSVQDELRGVLRRAMDLGARWDQVEIIAADPALYGSALHALAEPLGVPVTFAVGLPVERTRPGRIVTAYFQWIESDFREARIRALIEAGDVRPPRQRHRIAGPRLARSLRRLRIGWGRERHTVRIERALEGVGKMVQHRFEAVERFERRRERMREDLLALQALLDPVLAATPDVAGQTSPARVAAGAKSLLSRAAPGTDTDDTALQRLLRRLGRIEATLHRTTDYPSAAAIVKSFLEIRIPAPRAEGLAPWSSAAGHLYLTDLAHGGATGRRFTFIVGMDSANFPGSTHEDPLLLDRERWRLGRGELPLARERVAERRFSFGRLVARLRGTLVLSYCRWNPAEARELSPAPELLQALRLRYGDPALNFEDLEKHLGASESRLPRPELRADLDEGDVWLRALATRDGRLRDGLEAVGRAHPRLGLGMAAAKGLCRDEANVHAGFLGTPSPPLSYRDPSARTFSASGLESLGACPRRFLFSHILKASPPDDPEFDPHRWLNPMERGNLLHRVYERTLKLARERGLAPADDDFLTLALGLVERVGAEMLRRVPTPSRAVREWEMEALCDDARSFVEMIRGYPPPWIELEMAFGMDDDPTTIDAGGRPVRVRGYIDRLDDRGGRLRVVDYKTGGDYGYGGEAGPYNGGRRLQHFIYTEAARAVLGRPVTGMEYHFPTRRGENREHAFESAELSSGGHLVAALLDGVAAGRFPATDSAKDDCRFCDYGEVCGVRAGQWGAVTCRFADWTARNLGELPELDLLGRVRNWDR